MMPSTDLTADSYRFLQEYVYRESGIVLDGDKQYLMEARLSAILHESGLPTLNDLCALLRATADARLRQQVVEAMTTNETFFFRDVAQYEVLRTAVLPPLLKLRSATRALNFWSAASSSGQEAYSLAMMLLDMGLADWNIRILGTDLSRRMVDRSRSGSYLQMEVNRGLPVSCLIKYFSRAGQHWQLGDEVRRLAEFRCFDLREDMGGLGQFDVVFCRNVLIYFDVETRRRILREIQKTILPGGHLLLGCSETTLNLDARLERRIIADTVLYRVPA